VLEAQEVTWQVSPSPIPEREYPMKCQQCTNPATMHITEIVDGAPVEYHLCEQHLAALETLQPSPLSPHDTGGVLQAMSNPAARQKMAAHLLPALCLALLDEQADVRVLASFWLSQLGEDAHSALGALRTNLTHPEERVRNAAEFAIKAIQSGPTPT
jgi:hypothetical protein